MMGMVVGFVPTGVRSSSRFASKLMMKEEKTLSLEDKLAAKAAARMEAANKGKTTATVEKKVEKKVESKKASTTVKASPAKVAAAPKAAAPKATAPAVKQQKLEVFKELDIKEKPAPVKAAAAPVKVAATAVTATKVVQKASPVAPVTQKVVSVAPTAPPSAVGALSTPEALAGVGLGLAPYLLLPGLLLGGIKKAKPLPVEDVKPAKAQVYDAPLAEGAKQGISELLSGAKTEELELSRKGLTLSAAGFAASAVLFGALLLGGGGSGERGVPAEKAAVVKSVSADKAAENAKRAAAEAAQKADKAARLAVESKAAKKAEELKAIAESKKVNLCTKFLLLCTFLFFMEFQFTYFDCLP